MSPVAPTTSSRAVDPAFLAMVGIGGAIGSATRHGVVGSADDPAALVFMLNVGGSLLLGSLGGWIAQRQRSARPAAAMWSALIGLGFCGGLTTFSTHVVGIAEGVRQSTSARAVASALGSGVGTAAAAVVAAAIGFGLSNRAFPSQGDAR